MAARQPWQSAAWMGRRCWVELFAALHGTTIHVEHGMAWHGGPCHGMAWHVSDMGSTDQSQGWCLGSMGWFVCAAKLRPSTCGHILNAPCSLGRRIVSAPFMPCAAIHREDMKLPHETDLPAGCPSPPQVRVLSAVHALCVGHPAAQLPALRLPLLQRVSWHAVRHAVRHAVMLCGMACGMLHGGCAGATGRGGPKGVRTCAL